MHVAEFLNRTNRRNRNTRIDWQVKQMLRGFDEDLERRRQLLAMQLQDEDSQLEQELAELQQAQLDAAQNQRIEWIQMALMQQEASDRQLLQLKQQQRDIENSEEYRHEETRQILMDTKQSQLHQIAERRERRRQAAQLDALWQQQMNQFP